MKRKPGPLKRAKTALKRNFLRHKIVSGIESQRQAVVAELRATRAQARAREPASGKKNTVVNKNLLRLENEYARLSKRLVRLEKKR